MRFSFFRRLFYEIADKPLQEMRPFLDPARRKQTQEMPAMHVSGLEQTADCDRSSPRISGSDSSRVAVTKRKQRKWRICTITGKRSLTHHAAAAAMLRMPRTGPLLNVYRCKDCREFHVGHTPWRIAMLLSKYGNPNNYPEGWTDRLERIYERARASGFLRKIRSLKFDNGKFLSELPPVCTRMVLKELFENREWLQHVIDESKGKPGGRLS